MTPLRWGRVALRYSQVPRSEIRLRTRPLAFAVCVRNFHGTARWLKDPKDPKDPKAPQDPEDVEGAKDAADSVENKASRDSRSDPDRENNGIKPTEPPASLKDSENARKLKEAQKAQKPAKETEGDHSAAQHKDRNDPSDEDGVAAWDPPSDADHVERKRKALLGQQKRRSRRTNMFNPKEFEEQGSDVPPISTQERLLPIQLPFRPVYPGASTYMVSGDTQLMNVLRKLNDTPGWDHRIMAVMSKTPIKTAQLLTNTDDVHEIGCICLVDNISVTRIPDTDRYSAYAAVFPMYRARVGELVENVKAAVENPPNSSRDSDSALDQVTVQYMKGIIAVPNEPYAIADEEIQRQCVRVIDSLKSIATRSAGAKRLIDDFSAIVPQSPGGYFPQPDFLADFTASIMPKNENLQKILSETNVLNRLKLVSELASKEVMYLRVQEGIEKYGHNQSELRNREAVLNEYLRYIKKELGIDGGDDKSKSADKFLDRVAKLDMPSEVRRVFEEELQKFRSLEPTSGEYNTVRTYVDWLSALPWGQYTEDRFDLKEARRILDGSHYGMKDVKDRILEFLAVGKLNGTIDGKIVCLSGPPGVGKTSIAKSIAEALNRKFDRFSVGGLSDASEIKGHRRTYVAAMPGRIIQSLKRTQSQNPVILIDEIDKLGHSTTHGSPSAALLEVLDPEQNKNYQDTYLEVPMDLSRVLFLCTANYLESIPAPLKDRMEIIEVPGYLPEEKVHIATSHLAPKTQREAGLGSASVTLDADALGWLVRKYTREAGVRGLSKHIEKIFRKVAIGLVSEAEKENAGVENAATSAATTSSSFGAASAEPSTAPSATVAPKDTKKESADASANAKPEEEVMPLHDKVGKFELKIARDDLQKYVGPPVHNSDRMYEVLPVGVSMGLGWSPAGGMPLFIESVLQEPLSPKSKARFTKTGQLGEVMGESVSIAYSFARMFMARNYPRNGFLDHAVIHTHFPEGALKKDGPSAGITTVTSLLSLAMDVPMHNDVAMTGELSLTGKVLQIGGLREKAVAAKTAGAKIIIFPDDNRADWDDLSPEVREGLEARPVKHYQDVFDIVFSRADAAEINTAWPELKEKEEKERNMQSQVPI